jgi:hypothetical protein
MDYEPVLQGRGEQARDLLAAPGPVTLAEGIALALLTGDIMPPVADTAEGE